MKTIFVLILMLFLHGNSFLQDHSEMIEGLFETLQEVTEKCLMYNEEAGEEIMKTSHWNWLANNSESSDELNRSKKI